MMQRERCYENPSKKEKDAYVRREYIGALRDSRLQCQYERQSIRERDIKEEYVCKE